LAAAFRIPHPGNFDGGRRADRARTVDVKGHSGRRQSPTRYPLGRWLGHHFVPGQHRLLRGAESRQGGDSHPAHGSLSGGHRVACRSAAEGTCKFMQWIGISLSLAAIYLFNVPQESAAEQGLASGWLLLPLAAVVLWGITALMQKVATNHISAQSSAIWFLAAFIPVAGVLLLYYPLETSVKPAAWGLAMLMGFMLALGNLTILLAFSSDGKASIITPLAGLYPLVSIPIALVAFGERLSWRESLGIMLALVAVVMLSYQSEPNKTSPQPSKLDDSL
jgi:bacterial/archaeal transporter family protein